MATSVRREEVRCTRFEAMHGRSLLRVLDSFNVVMTDPVTRSALDIIDQPLIALVVATTEHQSVDPTTHGPLSGVVLLYHDSSPSVYIGSYAFHFMRL